MVLNTVFSYIAAASTPIHDFLEFFKPFPKPLILEISKLKEVADDNSKFDEYCWKFSIWVENTMGKGENACDKQFLLFP